MAFPEIMSDDVHDVAVPDTGTRNNGRVYSVISTLLLFSFVLCCEGIAGNMLLEARLVNPFIVAMTPQKGVEPSISSKLVRTAVTAATAKFILKPDNAVADTIYTLRSLFDPRALGYPLSAFGQSVLTYASFEPSLALPLSPAISTRRASSLVSPPVVEANHVSTTDPSSGLKESRVADADPAPKTSKSVAMPAAGFGVPQHAPVPTPRPHELSLPATRAPFDPSHRQQAKSDRAAPLSAQPDNRNFLEKLFGFQPEASGPTLAYASPEDGVFASSRSVASNPFSSEGDTAIYDISAHSVVLPNGSVLEAHSGLGTMLDDPRSVSTRDRGAIPPQVYNLTLRESLFHGVQALRLTPTGRGSVYGRDGFLAHTYMLGPRGDSNGCISFRNYPAFLQAYQEGRIKRLVVVAQR